MSLFSSTMSALERLEGRLLLASQTFSNGGFISIDSGFSAPTTATPYPSSINVSSVSGSITKIQVKLFGFGHDSPADVDALLVNPSGSSIILMSDAGMNFPIAGRTLTFDDGGGQLPDLSQINSGTYRPTNRDDFSYDDFPDAPGGGSPSGTRLSDLAGGDPNGFWSLYVCDDQAFNGGGEISGGWSLTIETVAVGPQPPSQPVLDASSDTGDSNSDGITKDNTPTFTGTADDGSTVAILVDGVQVASGVAAGGAYSITTPAIADGDHAITATATAGGNTSAPSSALNITIDTAAPALSAREFHYESGQNITYDFSEAVSGSLDGTDLAVQDLTHATTVPGGSISIDYNSTTNQALITFPGFANSILPDADYRATLALAGMNDVAGNAVTGNGVLDFFALAGDANRDRKVDVGDLGILATNWQQSPRIFSQADFNYDGIVNVGDLGILASNWQKKLTAPAPAASSPMLQRSIPSAIAPTRTPRLIVPRLVGTLIA